VKSTKQSKRAPVEKNMQRGTQYIFALPKRVGDSLVLDSPYTGAKAPSQAHVLVALDYLLTCPLQDPRPRKTRGVVSKGTKAIKDLWAQLFGTRRDEETAASADTASNEEVAASASDTVSILAGPEEVAASAAGTPPRARGQAAHV
jgi:hypothetical protein